MIDLILFILAFGADQLLKYWSVTVLAQMPGQTISVIENVFYLVYAENPGTPDHVSFLRGRSGVMNLLRLLQVVVVLYLLIRKRKNLRPITRVGLVLFLAGLVGNQFNYMIQNFVPDMFSVALFPRIVFNLADVYVLIAMVILFIRLSFFEGQDLVNWVVRKTKRSKIDPQLPDSPHDGERDIVQPEDNVMTPEMPETQPPGEANKPREQESSVEDPLA